MKNNPFENYNHLGFMSPLYYWEEGKIKVRENLLNGLHKKSSQELQIDPVSIVEFINKSYCFMDRTMIQNLNRTPWMARPSVNETYWEYDEIPEESEQALNAIDLARELKNRLQNEILTYIDGRRSVGILLSGGMDSRIVAGLLNKLIVENQIDITVVSLTWGMSNTRDIAYSKAISDRYGWEQRVFPITPELLKRNIEITAERGCEYSPIHLHAMPEIADQEDLDCILAGSFGDSIGRAEYSGVHASRLGPIQSGVINRFSLIRHNVYKQCSSHVITDVEHYHKIFKRNEQYKQFELDRQIHYMRKELNVCMQVINDRIPLLQVFSAPEVFTYMLNQKVELRTDKVYVHILNETDPGLLEIPWSRTGMEYNHPLEATPDTLTKEFHQYGKWIRHDLAPWILECIESGGLERINVFNMDSIKSLLYASKHSKEYRSHRIDEMISWLASMSIFLENNQIAGLEGSPTIRDKFNGRILAKAHAFAYVLARNKIKK